MAELHYLMLTACFNALRMLASRPLKSSSLAFSQYPFTYSTSRHSTATKSTQEALITRNIVGMSNTLASHLYYLAAVAANTIVLCLGGIISLTLPAPIMLHLDILADRALTQTDPNALDMNLPGPFRDMLLSSISGLLLAFSLAGYVGLSTYFSSSWGAGSRWR